METSRALRKSVAPYGLSVCFDATMAKSSENAIVINIGKKSPDEYRDQLHEAVTEVIAPV